MTDLYLPYHLKEIEQRPRNGSPWITIVWVEVKYKKMWCVYETSHCNMCTGASFLQMFDTYERAQCWFYNLEAMIL